MDPSSSHAEDSAASQSFGDLLAASQIETPLSLPGQTPPSTITEPHYSSSIAPAATSGIDIPGTIRRNRIRNDLGDFQMSQLLSDQDRSDAERVGGMNLLPSELSSFGGERPAPVVAADERVRVIWGTNIIIADAISSFRSFLANFTMAQRKRFESSANEALPNITANDLEPLYPRLLGQVHSSVT